MSKIKPEHSGAKNGGGYWGTREEAKRRAKKARRGEDRAATRTAPRKVADRQSDEHLAQPATGQFDFGALVAAIRQTHEHMAAQAGRAVNISLTLRNWAIGCHIREYEQRGTDRAKYGEGLLERVAEELRRGGMDRVEARELRRFRQFYQVYPQIWQSLPPELRSLLPNRGRAMPAQIRESATPESGFDGKTLLTKLSFTHLAELVPLDDSFKRAFYEIECIRGNWSVRELKRQIGSLAYERSGLSRNKAKFAALTQAKAERAEPGLAIRDPYVFEFLGIKSREVMSESNLEDALLDRPCR